MTLRMSWGQGEKDNKFMSWKCTCTMELELQEKLRNRVLEVWRGIHP